MGQYWRIVNLDKCEYLDPYSLDSGAKAWEQLAADLPSRALYVLVLAQRERRGGGDLDGFDHVDYHSAEREAALDGGEGNIGIPAKGEYVEVAQRVIGRWAGDRIAVVGDYAEDSDLDGQWKASQIYMKCSRHLDEEDMAELDIPPELFTDITEDVKLVLQHETDFLFKRGEA